MRIVKIRLCDIIALLIIKKICLQGKGRHIFQGKIHTVLTIMPSPGLKAPLLTSFGCSCHCVFMCTILISIYITHYNPK